jgi:hypothetical protein
MSKINKLVIFTSPAKLDQHAANYPCLVNYNPFTKTGVIDDGCGHYADVTFAAVTCKADMARLPAGPFENVVLIGFEVPIVLTATEE